MPAFEPARHLSRRTAAVEEPANLRMAQKARDLKAAGADVVSLTIGEPDFDTPEHIRHAATRAMTEGFTHYAPVAGYPDLRAAISKKLKDENGLDYSPAEVVVANGAKQAITNAAFAMLDQGDEVILLSPFWVAYEGIVRMAGGVPVILHAGVEEGFKVKAERIAAALTDRTKLVFINSPSNPSGAVYTKEELAAIAKVIAAHPMAMAVSDEIYESIAYEGEPCSIGALPGMKERTITVNGLSKGFAMTGWRVGYSAGPLPVAQAMGKVQGMFTAGVSAFIQRAALSALEGGREDVRRMCDIYRTRRERVMEGLSRIPGLTVDPPAGAFYVFPDVSAALGRSAGNHRIETVEHLCDWLLEEFHVALAPGSGFGDPHCIRLSFAASERDLDKGVERLGRAMNRLLS